MKLDAVNGFGFVGEAHDEAVLRFGGDFEFGGQRRAVYDEGVIARRLKRGGEVFENALALVMNVGYFSVERFGRTDDFAAEGLTQSLMAEADAEQRDVFIGAGAD